MPDKTPSVVAVYVKSPTLAQIPKRELSKDPIGRINMVYHEKSRQAFAVDPKMYLAIFPDEAGKGNESPEDALQRMLRDEYGLDGAPKDEEEEVAVEDSIYSILDAEDRVVTEAPKAEGNA
jgi:hypothetical protein